MLMSNRVLSALVVSLFLAACGGGGENAVTESSSSRSDAPEIDPAATLDPAMLQLAANAVVQPQFHMAPIVLDAPDSSDSIKSIASARSEPDKQRVPAGLAGVSTRHLTPWSLRERMAKVSAASAENGMSTALAADSFVKTYTPAQIREAYGLPALPAPGTRLSAGQAAKFGAGQTIYIVSAMHNPNVAAELAAFNNTFGLPGCTSQQISAGTRLPLAAAPIDGCVLSIAYTTMAGGLSNAAPAYNAVWATETALDVQWAHAIAPLARIVLIEVPQINVLALAMAVNLANSMGPGVVSMSFGYPETSWTSAFDYVFKGGGMTYVAATGDWGEQVNWPAVNPNVLAIGGTTLSGFWSDIGLRSEVAWGVTGGGISAYVAAPSYQASDLVGVGGGRLVRRGVADVAFNADPSTGQYVAVMAPGASSPSWGGFGGTSISTPQWAGLIAVANALRVLAGKSLLGAPHDMLYRQIAAVPRSYATALADIQSGRNGDCSLCSAQLGYDVPTGLGTPNAGALLGELAGTQAGTRKEPPVARSVSNMSGGVAGRQLQGSITWEDPGGYAMSYSMTNAPSGMYLTASGTTAYIRWDRPVAGIYPVYFTATNALGLTTAVQVTVVVKAY